MTYSKCTCMHISISFLDGQCLINPGEVFQAGSTIVAHTSYQNVQNPRMPWCYTSHTNNIAAKTLREEKLVKKLLFVLPPLFLSSTFPPQYRVINPAPCLLHSPSCKVIFSYLLYLASSLFSSPTSFLYVFYLSSLFYISLFSYSPMSPPPRTHTHCKPLNSSCAEPALPKLPSSCPLVPSLVLHSSVLGAVGSWQKH